MMTTLGRGGAAAEEAGGGGGSDAALEDQGREIAGKVPQLAGVRRGRSMGSGSRVRTRRTSVCLHVFS